MAKVIGPLMSLSASGKFAKTMVFLAWKGIQNVRQYVIPANPQSAGQTTQRGYLASAVTRWHTVPLQTADLNALNVLSSIQAKPMSGFNVFCKEIITNLIAGETNNEIDDFTITTNTGGAVEFTFNANAVETIKLRWGYSPTVMPTEVACGNGGAPPALYTGAIAGATVGDDVYFQMFTETATKNIISGIYKVRVLA